MNRKKKIIAKLRKYDKRANIKRNGGAKSQYISKDYQKRLATVSLQEVIEYWYSEPIKQAWFNATPELDAEIKSKYEFLWESAVKGGIDNWQDSAEGSLALAIIFDQFPLNMFRGKAKSFQTEENAIKVTKHAIDKGYLAELKSEQLVFIFMPLMHSENIENQDLSVELFKKYDLSSHIPYALQHQKTIKTFGRFPHRNQILDRNNTVKEREYLNSTIFVNS